jgi:hypothetical protein
VRVPKSALNALILSLRHPGSHSLFKNTTLVLIQERIHTCLYALVVQAILWNYTHVLLARLILLRLLVVYPTPLALSRTAVQTLTMIFKPISLQNISAVLQRELVPGAALSMHGCRAAVKPREVLSQEGKRDR